MSTSIAQQKMAQMMALGSTAASIRAQVKGNPLSRMLDKVLKKYKLETIDDTTATLRRYYEEEGANSLKTRACLVHLSRQTDEIGDWNTMLRRGFGLPGLYRECTSRSVHRALARLLIHVGELDQAIKVVEEKLITIKPEDPRLGVLRIVQTRDAALVLLAENLKNPSYRQHFAGTLTQHPALGKNERIHKILLGRLEKASRVDIPTPERNFLDLDEFGDIYFLRVSGGETPDAKQVFDVRDVEPSALELLMDKYPDNLYLMNRMRRWNVVVRRGDSHDLHVRARVAEAYIMQAESEFSPLSTSALSVEGCYLSALEHLDYAKRGKNVHLLQYAVVLYRLGKFLVETKGTNPPRVAEGERMMREGREMALSCFAPDKRSLVRFHSGLHSLDTFLPGWEIEISKDVY